MRLTIRGPRTTYRVDIVTDRESSRSSPVLTDPIGRKWSPTMLINSRTLVSVVGTLVMVVMTIVLATAWSPGVHGPGHAHSEASTKVVRHR